MSLRDELIEKIAEKLYYLGMARMPSRPRWEEVISESKDEWRKEAKTILALEVSGHRLLIGKVGAELPENPCGWERGKQVYREAQQDMLKEGWVKGVKGE